MSQTTQPRASLSLFPNPHTSNPTPPAVRNQTPLGRRSESRERRAVTPQQYPPPPAAGQGSSPSRQSGRETPQSLAQAPTMTFAPPSTQPVQEYRQQSPEPVYQQQSWPLQPQVEVYVQQPTPINEVPRPVDMTFGQSQTFVPDRSSIAKLPLDDDGSPGSSQQPIRSIFPEYNHEVALEHQQYVPTQMSPTHIPRNIISRQGNYMEDEDDQRQQPALRSPPHSPEPQRLWPRRTPEPPAIPTVCTTEQLKSLWRVANGWRASSSEGRVYCLKLSQAKDAPVYTLSSQTQPFWTMRMDPTSMSARVTLSRHDPSKTYKSSKPDSPSSSIFGGVAGNRKSLDSKNWQEALTTTLEENARRHRPNDGLVAMLMPTPASKMAAERSEAPMAVEMAKNECGRLIWDVDSNSHYLVHQALQKPFCVTIERSPAWSRVEYTLEHNESPRHIAKLTREGAGGGWIELDTGIASKIDSFYLVDVVVTALLLVAAEDEKNNPAVAVESFDAPPAPPKPVLIKDKSSKKGHKKIEEFELDLESQDGSLGKSKNKTKVKERKTEDRLPFLLRVIVKLTKGVFKTFIFFLTAIVKMFGLVFRCFYKCIGSKY